MDKEVQEDRPLAEKEDGMEQLVAEEGLEAEQLVPEESLAIPTGPITRSRTKALNQAIGKVLSALNQQETKPTTLNFLSLVVCNINTLEAVLEIQFRGFSSIAIDPFIILIQLSSIIGSFVFQSAQTLSFQADLFQGRITNPLDFIGYLDSVTKPTWVHDAAFTLTDEKTTARIKFTLKDTSGTSINCLAYGELAFQIDDRWFKNRHNEVIMTLSDWKLAYIPILILAAQMTAALVLDLLKRHAMVVEMLQKL
ncbi:unnamed protein product [Microthlaspi erraticum]|uniref:DUF223 domain-containing protein n=1 Tax=Microthlaspi erraticum TaxID=1685480 RepID=A0A6D2LBH3_9BRAS|nr:unnamed protein product [Microthlaspi erraticum]